MNRMPFLRLAAPLMALSGACVENLSKGDPAERACCTAFANASVSVTVANTTGDTDLGAELSAWVSGEAVTARCTVPAVLGNCTLWNVGLDTAGTFRIRAVAEGYAEAETEVSVEMEDECHVETQYVDLVLDAE